MFLGIDLGTSAVKSIIIDDDQNVVSEAQSLVISLSSQPPISEQDPAVWIAAVSSTLDQLHSVVPTTLAAVNSIGLSGHIHGGALMDKNSEVLRPRIMWNDGHSVKECYELAEIADFAGISGNLIMVGFTPPNCAGSKTRTRTVHQNPHGFVAQRLCPTVADRRICLRYVGCGRDTFWVDVAKRE